MILTISLSILSIGVLIFASYRLRAKQSVILQKAHAKNIRDIEVNDDVWLSGIIESDKKLIAPFFGYETVYYSYRRTPIHYQNTVNRDSKIFSETKSESCYINDQSGRIFIQLDKAEKSQVYVEKKIEGQFIHEIEYIPARGLLSAVGVVGPNKHELIKKGEVDLLVTPLGYKQYLMKSQQSLQPLRLTGLSFLWAGFLMSILQLLPLSAEYGQIQTASSFIFGICLPVYFYIHSRIIDRLIHLRGEVYTVWSQLDEHLTKRRRLARRFIQAQLDATTDNPELLKKSSELLSLIENIGLEKRYLSRIQMENELTVKLQLFKKNLNNENLTKLNVVRESDKTEVKREDLSIVTDLLQDLKSIETTVGEKSLGYIDVAKEYNTYIRTWYVESIAQKLFFEPVLYFGELKANLEIINYMKSIPQRKNDLRTNQAAIIEKRAQLILVEQGKQAS